MGLSTVVSKLFYRIYILYARPVYKHINNMIDTKIPLTLTTTTSTVNYFDTIIREQSSEASRLPGPQDVHLRPRLIYTSAALTTSDSSATVLRLAALGVA